MKNAKKYMTYATLRRMQEKYHLSLDEEAMEMWDYERNLRKYFSIDKTINGELYNFSTEEIRAIVNGIIVVCLRIERYWPDLHQDCDEIRKRVFDLIGFYNIKKKFPEFIYPRYRAFLSKAILTEEIPKDGEGIAEFFHFNPRYGDIKRSTAILAAQKMASALNLNQEGN